MDGPDTKKPRLRGAFPLARERLELPPLGLQLEDSAETHWYDWGASGDFACNFARFLNLDLLQFFGLVQLRRNH